MAAAALTNPVRCADCANFRLKEAKEMAELGFGLCAKGPSYRFLFSCRPLDCSKFELADELTRFSRWDWLAARGIRREAGTV